MCPRKLNEKKEQKHGTHPTEDGPHILSQEKGDCRDTTPGLGNPGEMACFVP